MAGTSQHSIKNCTRQETNNIESIPFHSITNKLSIPTTKKSKHQNIPSMIGGEDSHHQKHSVQIRGSEGK